jgi:phosphatidylserine/phosphatidylglycerophosphate/cardiolipin synthase-like enzyme
MKRTTLAIAGFAIAIGTALASPSIHYSPVENLEHVDVVLIDSAMHTIDMSAYILTDKPVIDALSRAANRGVRVRIYLDKSELSKDNASPFFHELMTTPGVEIRIKQGNAPMHLKSYAIDNRLLRTGAANFTASGLKQQDNDLVVLDNTPAVKAFEQDFERMFARGSRLVQGACFDFDCVQPDMDLTARRRFYEELPK